MEQWQKAKVTEAPSSRPAQSAVLAAMAQAAACPVHGCWEEEAAEEYERWDGMG